MTTQVEVKLEGMSDAGVHCSPCRNIPTLPNLSKDNTRKKTQVSKYENLVGNRKTEGETKKVYPFRLISTEEACVVTFLHHDVGDTRLIVLLQLYARISDGQQLVVENLRVTASIVSTQMKTY